MFNSCEGLYSKHKVEICAARDLFIKTVDVSSMGSREFIVKIDVPVPANVLKFDSRRV